MAMGSVSVLNNEVMPLEEMVAWGSGLSTVGSGSWVARRRVGAVLGRNGNWDTGQRQMIRHRPMSKV
jgi:hypothetical protein